MNETILLLEATDFRDTTCWHWVLRDNAGNFIINHKVDIDLTDPEYSGFIDLENYLTVHAAPDKWIEDHQILLKEVGSWICSKVFGPIAKIILDIRKPVVVRVNVPPEASSLLYLPLDLAYFNGKPLRLQNIRFVFESGSVSQELHLTQTKDALRMLAIFSLPVDVSALSLRRECHEISNLIRYIARTHGFAIDLKIIQYGATRRAIQEALCEKNGWDIIHISCHGKQASLLLEKDDGTPDLVSSDEIKELLGPARGRLKLVTLSSCLSAAAPIEETFRWLGLLSYDILHEIHFSRYASDNITSLATALESELDSAVLAMRYPVGDNFAIALSKELYEELLGRGAPLTQALDAALTKSLQSGYDAGTPPLSMITPILFGRRALGLSIRPPVSARIGSSTGKNEIPHFPPEPKTFIGRIRIISKSSVTLAPRSGKTGILLYGMAGSGKTTCACELSYHYYRNSHRFEIFVWYKAPNEIGPIDESLIDFALAMEKQIPGFSMVHAVGNANELEFFLPRLIELLEKRSLLVVIDGLESLLIDGGNWRDARWNILVNAFLNHQGLSRLIITSRKKPANLDERLMQIEPIFALSLNEAILFAREMPNLGKLLIGKSTVGLESGRELVKRTLELVQGHPKLLEFAEAQAFEPIELAKYIDRATKAWNTEADRFRAFFRDGMSSVDAEDLICILTDWTSSIIRSMPINPRIMSQFLCAIEEKDRNSVILGAILEEFWKCLNLAEDAPNVSEIIETLSSTSLIRVVTLDENLSQYIIHPVIAEAGRSMIEKSLQTSIDAQMTTFWKGIFSGGYTQEEFLDNGRLRVYNAGSRLLPYVLRLKEWETAAFVLQEVLFRSSNRKEFEAALPILRQIYEETKNTSTGMRVAGILAKALIGIGYLDEAEQMERSRLSISLGINDYGAANGAAESILMILVRTGRYLEALELIKEKRNYAISAGLGPWSQLHNETWRLKILLIQGRHNDVLSEVNRLLKLSRSLPKDKELGGSTEPWMEELIMLDSGRSSAMHLGNYEEALEFNSNLIKVFSKSGASELEISRARFNDNGPLINLNRYAEVSILLRDCHEVFVRENDIVYLGKVFGAMAQLEFLFNHFEQATTHAKAALRYKYLSKDIDDISISHRSLAILLANVGSNESVAHWLAAAVLRLQNNSWKLEQTMKELTELLDHLDPKDILIPKSFDELCSLVENVEGVRFKDLFENLSHEAANGDLVLQKVLAMVKPESKRPFWKFW